MPKRDDLRTILVLGSGPIVIGQGCEFDYSGAQACKALRDEGYRIVLVNSNPATIMTDPALSDRTYIEPITPETVRKILAKERDSGTPVDAVLPTLGGQTALNCACALFDDGVLDEFGVEMIGADRAVIHRAEDRKAFAEVCARTNLRTPDSRTVETLEEAHEFLEEIGTPAIVRPAFTLGGWGGGIAYNREEFDELVTRGIKASMIGQVQVDRSLIGWKEYELEVVRDRKDNCIIVCGIENIDAMGVHTGDSITVAPIQTLTDKEYQALRDASFAIMREVGVETGGSNVQFAINPNPKPRPDGTKPFEFVVVEMNPRVSRSSALASKATGFPIAKIAAKLAVGYTLDELRNDITGTTSACFEPAIDYVVTKMPRWTFEKFPEADETLTTQMKSVGEAMAIGRTLKESLQKVIRSMDVKRFGLGLDRNDKWLTAMRAVEHEQLLLDVSTGATPPTGLRTADGAPIEWPIEIDKLTRKLAVPSQGRLYYVRYAFKMGWTLERINQLTGIDPFYLDQIQQLVEFEDELCRYRSLEEVPRETMFDAKRMGFSDAQLANLYLGTISSEAILKVRARRRELSINPVYKLVDTCAAEFEAITPYYYSTYETGVTVDGVEQPAESELKLTDKQKVVILGGGPNRIGQGIEFDYCCVHAAFAARDLGYESVMINSNPETVSTDYDTSDLLFFEPLTLEDVLNVAEGLSGGATSDAAQLTEAVKGLIVQFGGQTPLNLAHGLALAGAPLIGTTLDSIDRAEDRDRFDALLTKLELKRPASGIARSLDEAIGVAKQIGYPVLVRPSYVLGGRGMEICADEKALLHYMATAVDISDLDGAPVLIDRFLDGATELDIDVVADFLPGETDSGEPRQALVAGVMEHIEQAGVHSGDSGCTLPPYALDARTVSEVKHIARQMAEELRVNGLMNLQLAVKDGEVYVIEVNPRASRTVPFVAKAKHVPWPAIAAKVMMGETLAALGAKEVPDTGAYAVKEPVFPFQKFPQVDFVLGPEMRSTGEVMGIDSDPPTAYLKALLGAGTALPREGGVFLSVRSQDKQMAPDIARSLMAMGYTVYATRGTGEILTEHGMSPIVLQKINAGARPNVLDLMKSGEIAMVINTPTRTGWQTDEGKIRASAVRLGVPMITTMTGARAAIGAIQSLRAGDWRVTPMQEWSERAERATPAAAAPVPMV
ncbi:MAG: carbamoyl-phosphate synthase large subunit [Planctomycetota bacterium]